MMKRKRHRNEKLCIAAIMSFVLAFNMIAANIIVSQATETNAETMTEKMSETDSCIKDEFSEELQQRDPAWGTRVFDHIDEKQFRDQDHILRLEDEEDLNTYVFRNSDGTNTVYLLNENVKYLDKDGEAIEKDLELISEKSGYTTKNNDVKVIFPKNIKDGIELDYLENSIRLFPINNKGNCGLEWNKSSVEYIDCLGEGINLRYTPTLDGFKEDIIIEQHSDISEFKFLLKAPFFEIVSDEEGYYLANNRNKEKIRLGRVYLYDSKGTMGSGSMVVKQKNAEDSFEITIVPDKEFLNDPQTLYPVTIDPTITVSDNTHGSNSIVDAPIFSGLPSQNCGTYIYDRVGNTGNGYGIGRTVVRLSGLLSLSQYINNTASDINSVKFCVKEAAGAANQTVNLYPLTTNTTWTETGVTWNNIGSYSTALNCGNTMESGQVTEFDITTLVKKWKLGNYSANAGFIMKNSNESNNECFMSSECATTANRPYVTYTYTPRMYPTESSVTLSVGQHHTFSVIACIPDNYHIKWKSSNTRIATINPNTGYATAKAPGRITITAYCQEVESVRAVIELTVSFSSAYVPGIDSGNVYLIKNAGITGTRKYMYTPSRDETWVSKQYDHETEYQEGKQLWYVVKTSLGYRLYSLGLRDYNSKGEKEMMLKGNSYNQMLKGVSEDSEAGYWSISYSDGYYYLTNTDPEFNNMSVAVDPDSLKVMSKKLSNETNYAKWEFEKITKSTFNNYWFGDYIGQTSEDIKTFKIELDTTGDDSIFANNIFNQYDFTNIGDYWDTYSNNIVIYGPNENVPAGTPYTTIRIYGNKTLYLTSDILGRMSPLSSNDEELEVYDDWYKMEIMLYTGASYTLRPNPLENDIYSRREVILHEIGHALKLAHPDTDYYLVGVSNGRGAYPDNNCVASVMNCYNMQTGYYNPLILDCSTPKYHDKINLTNRWG